MRMTFEEALREIRANAGRWYVYVIWDGETPFYVGVSRARKGCRQRLQDHRWQSSSRCREILLAGLSIGYTIDSWHDTRTSVLAREQGLIASLGRADDGRGPLINGNNGGFGHVRSHSPEARAKLSKSLLKSYEDPDRLARARAHLVSARSKCGSVEARAKRSVSSQRRWSKDGEHERQSAAIKKAAKRPEVRARLSATSRANMARPEFKAAALAVLRESNKQRPFRTAPYRRLCRQVASAVGWDLKNLPHPAASESVWMACALFFGARK